MQSFTPPTGSQRLRFYLCGVSFSQVQFTGTNPLDSGKGAYVGFGPAPSVTVTQPPSAIWLNVTSTMPPTQTGCGGISPATHDQGFRKYLIQTWYNTGSPTESATVKHQYNVEKGGTIDPKYAAADRLDLRLELSVAASGGYQYQAASRLHLSPAALDGCSNGWNSAINTKGNQAWVVLNNGGSTQVVPGLSLAGAKAFIWVSNGADTSNVGHVVTYQRAAVELIP